MCSHSAWRLGRKNQEPRRLPHRQVASTIDGQSEHDEATSEREGGVGVGQTVDNSDGVIGRNE